MKEFDEFVKIIRILRSENGCPWDREQTHESLRQCMLEEAYEVVDAVDKKDIDNLREELGDVLLQVVMNGVIAEEKKEFTMEEMIQEVSEKMVHRHPHVFGTTEVKNSDEVLKNWEELKQKEKKETSVSDSIKRIPLALPANIRAAKVQKKAAKVGFDFDNYEEVLSKVYEELSELEDAKRTGDICKIEEEFGDLLFSVVNLSRFLQINAENSLTNATNKFISRFRNVEITAVDKGIEWKDMDIDQMNHFWDLAKR